jgi:glycerophosphoryl diester phosphodiesterase
MWLLLLALVAVEAAPATPRPRLVAARGVRYHAPENTLPAFAAALELRVGIEGTVRRTRDGKLVVVQDAELGRTASGKGPVAGMTLAELKKLDAGSWFDREFAGERIPTVDEVLALVKQRRSGALVVLAVDGEGTDLDLGRGISRQGLAGQVVVTGLDAAARHRLRAAAPKVGLAATAARFEDLQDALGAPDADWVLAGFVPSAADAARVHKVGRRLLAAPRAPGYDPDICGRAMQAQVDALVTDFPLECRALWRSGERR